MLDHRFLIYFHKGTDILSYTSWDSQVDLRSQPRITIELEGFEELLAKSSEVFNDKIVEAILSSNDLTKLFEMKADGSGQFDAVITGAVSAIIDEIKGTVLEEMGFDPATNYTTFVDLEGYEGETVTFLGSTKVMGEWAVLIADVLDSDNLVLLMEKFILDLMVLLQTWLVNILLNEWRPWRDILRLYLVSH